MQNETIQKQKTDPDDELRIAEYTAKRRREDILEACRRAWWAVSSSWRRTCAARSSAPRISTRIA